MYITATAPYIFLTVMLVRGLTLDGAVDGIKYYVTPDFEKLSNYEVSGFLISDLNCIMKIKKT